MKYLFLLLTVFAVVSCQRKMPPWPYEGDKQAVYIQAGTSHLNGFSSLPASCQLFVYDEASGRTERHEAVQQGSRNRYEVSLFPGRYTAYCVTNAGEEIYWKHEEGATPDAILLKSQTQGGGRDHLLGQCEMVIEQEGANTFMFDLERKVGQLLIVLHNVPEWLTDLQIKVSNIPKTLSLTGVYDKGTQTVHTNASKAVQGESSTQLLVFPPQEEKKSHLVLVSKEQKYLSEEYEIQSIEANKITRVDVTFDELPAMSIADFTTSVVEWEKDTVKEEWEASRPEPDEPCEGKGNGYNLLANPGFEGGWTEGIPEGWKLDGGGASKAVSEVMLPVHEGGFAALLNGATYLYQDVAVEGGRCYVLKMFVNAAGEEVKWRYWCTWMKGSTPLSDFSDEVRLADYRYGTEGYVDAFEGKVVRAPASATRLRMEVRTYKGTPEGGEGLYVDGCSVEAVE